MQEVSDGIWRVTLPLPWELDHVHSHLMRGPDGWVIVDTGLGLPVTRARWEEVLAGLDEPVTRIVVTHFHPDHVGGTGHLQDLTGAPVYQGELDQDVCRRVWGAADWAERAVGWYQRHGVPHEVAHQVVEEATRLHPHVRWPLRPETLAVGGRFEAAGEEWEAVHTPGHADGHLCLFGTRTRRLLAGDHILAPITPNIGVHPESRPDPLGDYLDSLGRVAELRPSLALSGHGDPIADPAARAAELIAHHEERLEAAEATLAGREQSAYEASFGLFGGELSTHGRRFAVAETLSHLIQLVTRGIAERVEDADGIRWRLAR